MNKGFTLIEMIVVVLIGALILLLTIPSIQTVIENVRDKGCMNQLKVIDTAILQYMVIHDQQPTSLDDLKNENLISSNQYKCQNGKTISIIDGEAYVE